MDDTKPTGIWGAITGWFARPFNSSGDVVSWFLWVGVLIIAVFFWQLVLLEIQREI